MLDIIIGEKLNSSIKSTYNAMINFDETFIIKSITDQENAGADYIDVNTAVTENELDIMLKIVDLIINNSKCGISIDSPDTNVVSKTAEYIFSKGRKFIINSVTLTERIDEMIPVVLKYNCKIIAMPIAVYGAPLNVDERFTNAELIIEKFISGGVDTDNIIIDTVVESLLTNERSAYVTCETLQKLKEKYPQIKTICGISNISFGLPNRSDINAAFLSLVIHNGLDCAIYDVNAPENRSAVYLANLLSGDDEYCIEYINYTRDKKNPG